MSRDDQVIQLASSANDSRMDELLKAFFRTKDVMEQDMILCELELLLKEQGIL